MKKGFTLVETLVAMGILVLILMAIMNFGRDLFFINRVSSNNLLAQQEARQVLRQMVVELRSIAPTAVDGSYPLAQAATSSVIFYSDVDRDGLADQVRYFLSGTTLKRGVIKPSGSPLVYNSANEKLSTLSTKVTNPANVAIFNYYGENYTGTEAPLAFPVDTNLVRSVAIKVNNVTSQVSLRNLKSNL